MEMQRFGILGDKVDGFSLDLELKFSSRSVAYQWFREGGKVLISFNHLH